jgi:ribonuclease Z
VLVSGAFRAREVVDAVRARAGRGGAVVRAVLLGTGAPPPNPGRRGPATLLSLGDERFLVDAGSGVGAQLIQAGVRAYDWPRVLITHHHSDHVIDLGHLLITRWIVGQNAPFEVWGPAGTRRQVEKLLDYLAWDVEIRRAHMHARRPPEVRVTEIEEGKILEAGGVTVSAFLVDHDPVKPAFGYRFEGGGRSVVVSGDTRPSENLVRWSRGVDCLIHECCEMARTSWFPDCGWPTLEDKVKDLASYHTQPDQLGRVAREARPGTLVVTHLMPGSVPEELRAAAARDFTGPIVVGEDLLEV